MTSEQEFGELEGTIKVNRKEGTGEIGKSEVREEESAAHGMIVGGKERARKPRKAQR